VGRPVRGASQYLILGGKARAALHGRLHVTTQDIQAIRPPRCCGHRLVTSFTADAEGITADDIVQETARIDPAAAHRGCGEESDIAKAGDLLLERTDGMRPIY